MKRFSFNPPMCPTCAGLRADEGPEGVWCLIVEAEAEAVIERKEGERCDAVLEWHDANAKLAAANALLERVLVMVACDPCEERIISDIGTHLAKRGK